MLKCPGGVCACGCVRGAVVACSDADSNAFKCSISSLEGGLAGGSVGEGGGVAQSSGDTVD